MTIAALIFATLASYGFGLWQGSRQAFISPNKRLPAEGKRVLIRMKSYSPRYVVGARLPGNKWTNDLCHLRPLLDQSEIDAWREI